MKSDLFEVLGARGGVVCLVGAAGKKTTLYRLASEHPGRVGVTATVHIPYFPAGQGYYEVVEKEDDPFVLELLSMWKEKTGCRMLLNTSFNCQEPLVDTADHARATWKRTQLDVLITRKGIETEKGPA